MKKLLFLIISTMLCSCSCLLSQIPPQIVYVDQNCQGLIPDFTAVVIASDNCGPVILSQFPAPGFIMTVNNPVENVVITGEDRFGNRSQITVTVNLIDTIPPILEWPGGQIAMTDQQVIDLYNNWEAAVKVHGIAKWMYDQTWTQGMEFADSTVIDRLRFFTNVIELTEEEYAAYVAYKENY